MASNHKLSAHPAILASLRRSALIGTGALLFLGLLGAGTARATVRPFLYGGGQSIKTSAKYLNDMLDPVTVLDRVGSWEAGGGLRIFPSRQGGEMTNGQFHWEFRLLYGRGGGKLPGTFTQVVHNSQRNPYSYSVTEAYDHTYSVLGVSFLSRVLPQVGAFIGPAVQTVTFKGKLTATGQLPDPRYFSVPTSARDKKDVRYGLFNVGLQLTPVRRMPSLELIWVPVRANLSTTHRTSASHWQGNYPDMKASVEARIDYDF